MSNAPASSAFSPRPVAITRSAEQSSQAGTPHIPLSSEQIRGYISKINNHLRTPEHNRFNYLPATPGRLNPQAVAQESTPPPIQITTLEIHKNPPRVESAPSAISQVGHTIPVLATLIAGIGDEGLVSALTDYINEQRVLGGV